MSIVSLIMDYEELTKQFKARVPLFEQFPERKHSGSTVSVLLSALLASGYTTIGEIDQLIDKGEPAFRLYEEESPPMVPEGVTQYTDVGVVRATLHILDDTFLWKDRAAKIADEEKLK